jgi:hypothetical protein
MFRRIFFRKITSPTSPSKSYIAQMQRNAMSTAYNHALYLEPRTTMMQEWANGLTF